MRKVSSIGLALLVLLVLGTPIGFFYYHFHGQHISSTAEHWGQFGDYVGGLLNPIIGILNLTLFGYLTWRVSNLTNASSQNLFMLQKRMDAFESIMQSMSAMNLMAFDQTVANLTNRMRDALAVVPQENLQNETRTLIELANSMAMNARIYAEFHDKVKTFRVRYGHLFNYDFTSSDHRDFVEAVAQLDRAMQNLITSVGRPEAERPDNAHLLELSTDMFKRATTFIEALRRELS